MGDMKMNKPEKSIKEKFLGCAMLGAALLMPSVIVSMNIAQDKHHEELTFKALSGPEKYGTKWLVETDKGTFAVTGLTYREDRKDLQWAGDIVQSFEKGATYCAETLKFDPVVKALDGDAQRPERYLGTLSRKTPGIACPA
jgi:hypothetical protein